MLSPMTNSENIATVRRWCRDGTALRIRTQAQLTLADLARDVGVSYQTIRAWELGQRVPSADHAIRFGEVLEAVARVSIGAGDAA